MNRQDPRRLSFSQNDMKEPSFDGRLNNAIMDIRNRTPDAWEIVMGYIRSLALPIELDPRETEMVQAEYHKKSALIKLVKRLDGLDQI